MTNENSVLFLQRILDTIYYGQVAVIYDDTLNSVHTYNNVDDFKIGKQLGLYTFEAPDNECREIVKALYEFGATIDSGVLVCRKKKDRPYHRFRLDPDNSAREDLDAIEACKHHVALVSGRLAKELPKSAKEMPHPMLYKMIVQPEEVPLKKEEKEKKKMNDFSLTNLKDALIDKITSLDKKTITILAIIVLLLLIATRYQDIKDILAGIRDKVKRSKNFKAMTDDAKSAISSLKKIIGIKNTEGDDSNES